MNILKINGVNKYYEINNDTGEVECGMLDENILNDIFTYIIKNNVGEKYESKYSDTEKLMSVSNLPKILPKLSVVDYTEYVEKSKKWRTDFNKKVEYKIPFLLKCFSFLKSVQNIINFNKNKYFNKIWNTYLNKEDKEMYIHYRFCDQLIKEGKLDES